MKRMHLVFPLLQSFRKFGLEGFNPLKDSRNQKLGAAVSTEYLKIDQMLDIKSTEQNYK